MAREPIHPGETLRDDLEALGMSAAELARRIEVPVNRITQILNGQRAVTGDTALRLGRFFGTAGEFWLNLQKLYDLRLAGRERGDEIERLPSIAGDRRLSAPETSTSGMSDMPVYDLHWHGIPMPGIDRTVPACGGVYAIALDTTERGYIPIYVGKSVNTRRRGRSHLQTWFTAPNERYWIPRNPDAFLRDPVAVFNANDVALNLPNRNEVMRQVRERSWFLYATPDLTGSNHALGHLEYVLQEGVKERLGIGVPEHVGDSGRRDHPPTDLVIANTFAQPSLAASLPPSITFRASRVSLD